MIRIEHLSKHYHLQRQKFVALDDINLTIANGEIFGIIGRSGAGKSTLVRCMNLLERPDKGRVIIGEKDLTTLDNNKLRQARRNIGKIFQHFNLLESRNVFDNIALPLELAGKSRVDIRAKVTPLLELVGLNGKTKHKISELSGGQKQRVAIARALAADPQLLLCDEATSALDPETTRNILKLLQAINKKLGLTIVLITHEMDVVKEICHKVAVLDHGRCIEQGKVLDIFANPQHQVTKSLTASVLRTDLPDNLANQIQTESHDNKDPVIKLTFVGDNANKPIINDLHERYGVITNILQADLQWIDNASFGVTICQLAGKPDAKKQALQYLQQHDVKAEVLGYV